MNAVTDLSAESTTGTPRELGSSYPSHSTTPEHHEGDKKSSGKTYVVEHLDPELEEWSSLEYSTIARESLEANARFILSSVPSNLAASWKDKDEMVVEQRGVDALFAHRKHRVCLLDPAAKTELSPNDHEQFDVFLFGGILGDDPPRDRTSELRDKGFEGRSLGPVQMTTDTAVRTVRIVIQDQRPLQGIQYVDFPELRLSPNESTEMPFRYIKDTSGEPVIPRGMIELIKKDSEKGVGDLF